MFMIKVIL